ncbi:MAG TPA: peptide-methionine (R)-S-oxide reductase, partial [Candidatus Saccharimonadales bacterium]|nr:peptide-methionine (R)-S-oxide reductase [Candidatus Saccharimonadales bacterium]
MSGLADAVTGLRRRLGPGALSETPDGAAVPEGAVLPEDRGSPVDDEVRHRLSRQQYEVTRHGATERPFSGIYWDHHETGMYRCVVCRASLFDSNTKFDSRTGWPSFWDV